MSVGLAMPGSQHLEQDEGREVEAVVGEYTFILHVLRNLIGSHIYDEAIKLFKKDHGYMRVAALLSPRVKKAFEKHKAVREEIADIFFAATIASMRDTQKGTDPKLEDRLIRGPLRGFSAREMKEILNEFALSLLVALLGEDKKKTTSEEEKTALAAVLSKIDLRTIPKKILNQLKPAISEAEGSIELGKDYFLCSDAEPRMHDALNSGLTMLVNEHLLLKFKGRISALCLKTFTTKDGYTFVEGYWYTPMGEYRAALRKEFEKGVRRIPDSKGRWSLVRDVDKKEKRKLLKDGKKNALALPEKVSPEEAAQKTQEMIDNLERQRDTTEGRASYS